MSLPFPISNNNNIIPPTLITKNCEQALIRMQWLPPDISKAALLTRSCRKRLVLFRLLAVVGAVAELSLLSW